MIILHMEIKKYAYTLSLHEQQKELEGNRQPSTAGPPTYPDGKHISTFTLQNQNPSEIKYQSPNVHLVHFLRRFEISSTVVIRTRPGYRCRTRNGSGAP